MTAWHPSHTHKLCFSQPHCCNLWAFMKRSACCNHFVTDAWSLMDIPGSSCLSCLPSCQILITLIDSHFLNLTGSRESLLLCVNAAYFAFIVWSRWLLLTFCGLWSPHHIAAAWFLFKCFVCLLVIFCCSFFFNPKKDQRPWFRAYSLLGEWDIFNRFGE